MSRGLDWLQREILATLDEAKANPVPYQGGVAHKGLMASSSGSLGVPGRVSIGRARVMLPNDVYDLRASCYFLGTRHQKTGFDWISGR